LSAFGQKTLQVSEKEMTGIIFRGAGDNETIVEVQSNVPLTFESTMDKQVYVYETYLESGFYVYKLNFPTGNMYKGRKLIIKSYGFINYDYPLDLQAKVSVGLLILDPDMKMGMDIITLKNGDDILSLIQEIGEVNVKYKKLENPNGPDYTLSKTEIIMIRYANGSRDVFSDSPVPAPIVVLTQEPKELHFTFRGIAKNKSLVKLYLNTQWIGETNYNNGFKFRYIDTKPGAHELRIVYTNCEWNGIINTTIQTDFNFEYQDKKTGFGYKSFLDLLK